MLITPVATRQEGTQTNDLRQYWRDCRLEGEHLLAQYRRILVNRGYAQQKSELVAWVHQPGVLPTLRRLIAATRQELTTRPADEGLRRYRNALTSLWEIVVH